MDRQDKYALESKCKLGIWIDCILKHGNLMTFLAYPNDLFKNSKYLFSSLFFDELFPMSFQKEWIIVFIELKYVMNKSS